MSMNIRRVTAIPAELAANTIYLVADGTDGLVVAVTNAAAELVRKTKTSAEIETLVSNASGNASTDLANAVQALGQLIADEVQARTTADSGLDTRVTANSNALALEVTNRENAVSDALQDSKDYTDSQIASLDMSNSAVFAADIAARDALVLTKNTFVFVADASADATVDAGAALYFYNLATTSYTKVAEYESMDFTIPNLGILADLSDIGGALGYKGALVATVLEGTHEW